VGLARKLRSSAWRLDTAPPRARGQFARDLADVARLLKRAESRAVRELADGLLEFARECGRRWRWVGARDLALALAQLLDAQGSVHA
jgi:hypothetical protein